MLNKFAEGELTKRVKVAAVTAADKFPMLQIQGISTETYQNYSVVGNILTLFADDTDGAQTDSDYPFDTNLSAYNTFAKLRDAINATGKFRCFLIGAQASATSTSALVAVANATCKTDNGVTLYMDDSATATAFDAGLAITNQKFISRPSGGLEDIRKGRTYDSVGPFNSLCENEITYIDFTLTCVGNGVIEVYSVDDLTDTETLMWSNAWVTATREYHGDAAPTDVFLKSLPGERLLMHVDRATATTDITSPNIIVHGTTKDITGGDVPGANYTGCA